MRILFGVVEKIAIKTGVPIGGVWLVLLTFGGGLWLVNEYPFFTKQDLMIGFAMWSFANIVLWVTHRDVFWMDPKLLKALRDAAQDDGAHEREE